MVAWLDGYHMCVQGGWLSWYTLLFGVEIDCVVVERGHTLKAHNQESHAFIDGLKEQLLARLLTCDTIILWGQCSNACIRPC